VTELRAALRAHNFYAGRKARLQGFLRRTPAGHARIPFVQRLIEQERAKLAAVDSRLAGFRAEVKA
jgi:hypothetical protein